MMSKEKTKKKRTEEQAAFIVGNRKEICSCETLKDRAERLKDVEGPPMVNIAEFYMQKTNGSAIAKFLSSRYAAEYAKK